MSTLRRYFVVAVAFTAVIAACSSSGRTHEGAGSATFWTKYAVHAAMEADRPGSVAILAQRSDAVVLGKVSKIVVGRDYTDPGKAPNRTHNLTIAASSSRPKAASFIVEVGAANAETLVELPSDSFVFYLTKWYVDRDGRQVYRCTSAALCVIGALGENKTLTTVRDPNAAAGLAGGLPGSVSALFGQSAAQKPLR